jgi:hypothetical protein
MAQAAGTAGASQYDYQNNSNDYIVTQSVPPALVYDHVDRHEYGWYETRSSHWGGQQFPDRILGVVQQYGQWNSHYYYPVQLTYTDIVYDMTFCHPTLTTMDVSINLKVAGSVYKYTESGTQPTKGGMQLQLQEGSSGDVKLIGRYAYPPGHGTWWGSAAGAFSSIATPEFSGTFTSPTFSVPASPTGVTVPIRLVLGVQSHNTYDGYWHVVDFISDGKGIGFPIDAPVFNLPAGGCVNSVDAHIVDNLWVGPPPPTVAVSGSVSSDCNGPLGGVTVMLTDGGGTPSSTTTAGNGTYSFPDVPSSANPGQVSVAAPAGYEPVAPVSVALDADQTAVDFALACDAVPVSVSGIVSSDCTGPLENVIVGLVGAVGEFDSDTTDASGAYSFVDVAASDEIGAGEVSISIPLGFEAVSPVGGEAAITLDANQTVDFTLSCLDPTGSARGKGYWKHNANVYLKNKGNAQESEADMTTNFLAAVFHHFHENELNGIAVEGVSFMDAGGGPEPLDLATIGATLSVKGNAGMLAKAKQQYLAFLLNVASGKLSTFAEVSADGRTASQVLQYVADLINDGDSSNDEAAKDICDDINNAKVLPAGVVPEGYSTIYYARPQVADSELSVFPNPGRGSKDYTLSFAIPVSGRTSLEIYNVAGRRVATLVAGELPAGRREVAWQGRDSTGRHVGQGVYFARLITPQGTKTTKFVHLGR